MVAITKDQARRIEGAVGRLCATARSEQELLGGLAGRLRPALDHDAAAWLTTDPSTVLFTDSLIEGFHPDVCSPWFENELLHDDVNKFVELAAGPRPAAVLSAVTDPAASARWREVMRPSGFDAELRATFLDGTGCWGVVELHREAGRPDFTPAEIELFVAIGPQVAAGLRRLAVERDALTDGRADGPGLVIVHPDGSMTAGTETGGAWLELLEPQESHGQAALLGLAALVRGGRDDRPLRTQVRVADGRWATLHASPLTIEDGATAVIVEPAPTQAIALVLARAYGLSEREQEVTTAVARGAATAEIARDLHISPHTVRDHLKSAFAKVGVSSRTELVARLFHDH
jgi:DNA-binding CsgD family transcriptional regulator